MNWSSEERWWPSDGPYIYALEKNRSDMVCNFLSESASDSDDDSNRMHTSDSNREALYGNFGWVIPDDEDEECEKPENLKLEVDGGLKVLSDTEDDSDVTAEEESDVKRHQDSDATAEKESDAKKYQDGDAMAQEDKLADPPNGCR